MTDESPDCLGAADSVAILPWQHTYTPWYRTCETRPAPNGDPMRQTLEIRRCQTHGTTKKRWLDVDPPPVACVSPVQ